MSPVDKHTLVEYLLKSASSNCCTRHLALYTIGSPFVSTVSCCGTLCTHSVDCWMNVTEPLSAISQCTERIRSQPRVIRTSGLPTHRQYTLVPRQNVMQCRSGSVFVYENPQQGANVACCSFLYWEGSQVDGWWEYYIVSFPGLTQHSLYVFAIKCTHFVSLSEVWEHGQGSTHCVDVQEVWWLVHRKISDYTKSHFQAIFGVLSKCGNHVHS